MKLAYEFRQLPFRFDVAQLQQEVAQFAEADWVAHHENFQGNSSIPMISVGGAFNNEFKGPMAATPALQRCSYIQQVIASFDEVIGRSRLMRLGPRCEVPLHSDINYHWYKRVRIHIPITTNPAVIFHCGDKAVHMQAGDCWIFNSWKYHKVVNDSDASRVHLVIDLAGSSRFWSMVDAESTERRLLPYEPDRTAAVRTEQFNFPTVMPPAEVELLVADLLHDVDANPRNDVQTVQAFRQLLLDHLADWRELWCLYECQAVGWPHYRQLRDQTIHRATQIAGEIFTDNQAAAVKVLRQLILVPALSTEVANEEAVRSAAGSAPPAVPNVNRNAACPCGSGEKYKHCHGRLS